MPAVITIYYPKWIVYQLLISVIKAYSQIDPLRIPFITDLTKQVKDDDIRTGPDYRIPAEYLLVPSPSLLVGVYLKGLFGYMLLLHISEVDKQSILDNKW